MNVLRQTHPHQPIDPIEIDLVYNVRSCGTCSFFWPSDGTPQPYGPYPSFDPSLGQAQGSPSDALEESFPWISATTGRPAFPDPEIMDGCRKAPIMTVGINPNLTAFAPGSAGASWAYPAFTSVGHDEWADYAYYYRYRSVYQERFDLEFVKQFLVPEGRVVAPRDGVVTGAIRTSSSPSFDLTVRYQGDPVDSLIPLRAELGEPRWVVLFDTHPPNNVFHAGDVVAARLDVPAGEVTEVFREEVGYYEQFVPTLRLFEDYLRSKGYDGRALAMGEDVGQLDMVACASPHWTPDFLGGTPESEQAIIHNCVDSNSWVVKQLVHTQPGVLFLVGEASWDMFNQALGHAITRDPALPQEPADGAFTLLAATTDSTHPAVLSFSSTVDGTEVSMRTRVVVTPHFSYSTNFLPQFRLSPDLWTNLQASTPDVSHLMLTDPRLTAIAPAEPTDYAVFLVNDTSVLDDLPRAFPDQWGTLLRGVFYDPHAQMSQVLIDMFDSGDLSYAPIKPGGGNVLTRGEGPCSFCVNSRWQFPLGCPYDKPALPAPPPGTFEEAARRLVQDEGSSEPA
jgi:hypothetical protein